MVFIIIFIIKLQNEQQYNDLPTGCLDASETTTPVKSTSDRWPKLRNCNGRVLLKYSILWLFQSTHKRRS